MNRERRAVLRGIAALTGVVAGSGASSAEGIDTGEYRRQQVAAELQPGVTLFDLDGDGEYAVTVEEASAEMRDDDHPEPIHVTSGGRSTVDYAVSVVEPPAETTLGSLDRLSYDYYEGVADSVSNGPADGENSRLPPGEPFLVVENDDGRHGFYLTDDSVEDDRAAEEWWTLDVLDRLRSGSASQRQWFEYTTVEDSYDGRSFEDVIGRFGEAARLVRVGVGHGDAVTPATLDAYFGNLIVRAETLRFPTSVVNRVS